jgi:hypothetical protein
MRGDPDPLFMSQPSQMPATQVYHSIPPPMYPETQANGHASDEDAHSDAGSEHSAHSEHSDGSHSDASAGDDAVPAIPRLRPNSQPEQSATFPTLTSLPKDWLRHGVDGVQNVWSRVTGAKSEAAARESSSEESDESESDSSDDEEASVPESVRSRFAGASRSAKKPRTRGMMRGW